MLMRNLLFFNLALLGDWQKTAENLALFVIATSTHHLEQSQLVTNFMFVSDWPHHIDKGDASHWGVEKINEVSRLEVEFFENSTPVTCSQNFPTKANQTNKFHWN